MSNTIIKFKRPNSHKNRIQSKEWFINKANLIHKNTYDYNNTIYDGIYQPLKIKCLIHGEYDEIPRNHLRGKKCPLCSNKLTKSPLNKTSIFVEKCKIKHNNFYNYSKVIYKGEKQKIIIICPLHGDFHQSVESHLVGKGCNKCASLKRNIKNNNHFSRLGWVRMCKDKNPSLYIIKCFNDTEEFIKVGITKNSVERRFVGNSLPYNYNILKIIEDTPENIWNLEKTIFKKYKESKYLPNLYFKGHYECININQKDNILNDKLY